MVDSESKFPVIKVKGGPKELGMQVGKELKSKIMDTVEYYVKAFQVSDDKLREATANFRTKISGFNNNYAIEIESIAKAVGLEDYLIYAINARSELLNNFYSECTVFYARETGLLCENWDWSSHFEDKAVVIKVSQGEHRFMSITEPGILGKIGFNNVGIGVALNYLGRELELTGIPIHIILRAILDASSFQTIEEKILPFLPNVAGHILVAERDVQYRSIELAGDRTFEIDRSKSFVSHTNHFLGDNSLNYPIEEYQGSIDRYNQVNQYSGEHVTIELSKSILLNKSSSDNPVCRPFILHDQIDDIGTVCSAIFDLKRLEMHLTRGNPFDHEFEVLHLNE